MDKQPPLPSLIKDAEITLQRIRFFVIQNAMIDPNVSLEARSQEINKLLVLNKFQGMADAVFDVCQDQRKREELKQALLTHQVAMSRLYVPDAYMKFVTDISKAAFASFKKTGIAKDVIHAWKNIAPEFINMETGYYTSISDTDKKDCWLITNETQGPYASSYARKRLNEVGLHPDNLIKYSQMASTKLTEEWRKALDANDIPVCQIHIQSKEHPADPCMPTLHPNRYYYYTLTEKSNAFIDLRYLTHIVFHEPEHVFQNTFAVKKDIFPPKHSLYRPVKEFASTFRAGPFCPPLVFNVDPVGKYPREENLGSIAYGIYRDGLHEVTAHQHGYLAELQLHKATGIPLLPETQENIKVKKHHTKAIPKALLPRQKLRKKLLNLLSRA